jgi:hypothetical protein
MSNETVSPPVSEIVMELTRVVDERFAQQNESITHGFMELQKSLRPPLLTVTVNNFKEPGPDNVLSLNVGGTLMEVSRGTLTSIPGYLASKFSGEWDDRIPKDLNGCFFVDEDPELFRELIIYLREHNRMIPGNVLGTPDLPIFEDPKKEKRFFRMLVAFFSDQLIPLYIYKHDGATERNTKISDKFDQEITI